MSLSDEQVKDVIDLKEWVMRKIESHQEEIRMLEKQLEIYDHIVKRSSFTKASSLPKSRPDAVPIVGGGGQIIANAYITPEKISIEIDESIRIGENVPPLKTFFIDRIIGEMRRKDASDESVSDRDTIDCIIHSSDGLVRKITVSNYRHRGRADEIISSAGWTLNKMLERAG